MTWPGMQHSVSKREKERVGEGLGWQLPHVAGPTVGNQGDSCLDSRFRLPSSRPDELCCGKNWRPTELHSSGHGGRDVPELDFVARCINRLVP